MRTALLIVTLASTSASALDAGIAPPPETPPRGAQIYGSDFSGLMEDAFAPKAVPERAEEVKGKVKFRLEPREGEPAPP